MNWRKALGEFRPYVASIIPFVVLAGILLSSRGIIVVDFLHDFFIVLDGSWRAAEGQIPHISFHTPIGQAYFWPFAVLARFGDIGVATLLRADVLVAAFVVAVSLVSLRRRLSPLFFGLAVFAMTTVAMQRRRSHPPRRASAKAGHRPDGCPRRRYAHWRGRRLRRESESRR